MANAAVGAAQGGGGGGGGGVAGANPFQIATNLYAEKNLQGSVTSQILSGTSIQQGGSVNAGQYLRALRLMYRTTVVGSAGTGLSTDGAIAAISGADLTNVDGSEILYNMSGFSHIMSEKYFRPWLTPADRRYDYIVASATSAGAFTLSLQPEIRR